MVDYEYDYHFFPPRKVRVSMFRKFVRDFIQGVSIGVAWGLQKRKVAKSEYDIVYRWYEEKCDECDRLQEQINSLTMHLTDARTALEVIRTQRSRKTATQ